MDTSAQYIRILLVGGGTGGHFYPLISIAEALNAGSIKPQLFYAGPDRYDADILALENITFIYIPAGKRRRYASIRNFFDLFKTAFGTFLAVIKLYVLYPDVVMSKGGYTSVPVVLAAGFLRIPIVVHESDAVMGSANALASKFAHDVVVTYPETQSVHTRAPIHILGIPVRKTLLKNSSHDATEKLAVDPNRPVILVLGGSQGAERVNELILDSLDELLVDLTVIHQTGKQNIELCKLASENLIPDIHMRKHYHPVAFLDASTLNDAYHLAKIVISRAGSNSIYEIALHGKPAILIPIPEEISHDQRTNAYAYARAGGASVMEERNLTDSLLRAEIDRIMQNSDIYTRMVQSAQMFAKRDAAENIGTLLTSVAMKH